MSHRHADQLEDCEVPDDAAIPGAWIRYVVLLELVIALVIGACVVLS